MGQPGEPAGLPLDVDPRPPPLGRRGLGVGERRERVPEDLGGAGPGQVRPGQHPSHGDVHEDPLAVVLLQPAVPHPTPLDRSQVGLHLGGERVEVGARRDQVHRGEPLGQHEAAGVGDAVLSSVVRHGDVGVGRDPIELLRKAEGGRAPDQPGLPVVETTGGHRRDHRPAGRGDGAEGGGQVTPEDGVHLVGPPDWAVGHDRSPLRSPLAGTRDPIARRAAGRGVRSYGPRPRGPWSRRPRRRVPQAVA